MRMACRMDRIVTSLKRSALGGPASIAAANSLAALPKSKPWVSTRGVELSGIGVPLAELGGRLVDGAKWVHKQKVDKIYPALKAGGSVGVTLAGATLLVMSPLLPGIIGVLIIG